MSPSLITMPVVRPRQGGIAELITAIGTAGFGARLIGFLDEVCGAEHWVAYRLGADSPSRLDAGSLDGSAIAHDRATVYLRDRYWSRDPAMREARQCVADRRPAIIRLDIPRLPDTELRDRIFPGMRDRVVLCGQGERGGIGVSLVRTRERGAFTPGEVDRLGAVADPLLAILTKHLDLVARPSGALASLPSIEAALLDGRRLPRREAQVCARVLYGMGTPGIALDLGLAEESVKTYRKRAYRRLGLGCERELLKWFLAAGQDGGTTQ